MSDDFVTQRLGLDLGICGKINERVAAGSTSLGMRSSIFGEKGKKRILL